MTDPVGPGLVAGAASPVLAVLMLSVALAFVRLLRGPGIADRVVALDLIAVVAVGILATLAILRDQPVFLDAAIVVALIGFLGTIAFAQYLPRDPR